MRIYNLDIVPNTAPALMMAICLTTVTTDIGHTV